ncbi:MAG TPA: hypothetical protein VEV43_07315 [Actinomycetota bacterium]|nr:hypothetical protein [Actinomycetota bacterium]
MRRAVVAIAAVVVATGLTPPASATPLPRSIDEARALFEQPRDGGSNQMFIQLVPPGYKGYRWTVLAYKKNPRAKTSLVLGFIRTGAQDTQSQRSEFRWELPRGAMRMASDLRPVSLDTRRGMGNNGFVDMKLTHTERYMRFPAQKGCRGAVSFRVGRFGGRFRFNARDEYFKRISMQGVQVLVYREHDYRCGSPPQQPPPCEYDLELEAPDPDAGLVVQAKKTPEGRVDQRAVAFRALDTGLAVHVINASIAVPEAFEASEDLTSASVDGDAAGPWLSGDLSYVGPPATEGEVDDCGANQASSGIATGDYTAHFDSIGDVTVAATGLSATVRRRI